MYQFPKKRRSFSGTCPNALSTTLSCDASFCLTRKRPHVAHSAIATRRSTVACRKRAASTSLSARHTSTRWSSVRRCVDVLQYHVRVQINKAIRTPIGLSEPLKRACFVCLRFRQSETRITSSPLSTICRALPHSGCFGQ